MYVVKKYRGDDRYFGVYEYWEYTGNKVDLTGNDNLVVRCYSEDIANKIAELMNLDDELQEKDEWNNL